MNFILSRTISGFIRERYYKVIPYQIRKLFNSKRRDFVFQQAMLEFLSHPEACVHPENTLLSRLIYGWGNEAWSAREEYLATCISYALSSPGPILECGSGLSTLLIAAIAEKQGRSHWVLEHKPVWAKTVESNLTKYNLESNVSLNPLKDYGDFYWYDTPLEIMPFNFSLVICDGPPRLTKGGRYGLVPVMKDRLQSGGVILLDDAYRLEELEIAKKWKRELNASITKEGKTKPYFIVTLP